VSDEGFIDIEKLDVFLRRVGYSSSESELIGIIRRMDKNGDMTITFKEWQDYFQSLNEVDKSIVSIQT
jgi:Ca2+-binding EF-hand superfamily protein